MDKRALSAMPRPSLTDKEKGMQAQVSGMRYLVTASREEIQGEDTLVLNFFRAGGEGLKPAFRTFCQMGSYITQDLGTDRTKWRAGAVSHLTGSSCWYREEGNTVVASARERGIILGFLCAFREKHGLEGCPHGGAQGRLGANMADTELGRLIDRYQGSIKKRRLQEKHGREKAMIDLQMGKFGGIPEDYGQFVREKVFSEEHYIFYSSVKGMAYCTSCGQEFGLDSRKRLWHREVPEWKSTEPVRHNHSIVCPCCWKCLACKSEGMGRGKLFAAQWSVMVQAHGREVLVRYFCHTKDFRRDYREPEYATVEKFRTVHSPEKGAHYEVARFKGTNEVRWCIETGGRGWFLPAKTDAPRSAVLYNSDIGRDVAGTCMEYSAVGIYIGGAFPSSGHRTLLGNPWALDWYFSQYRRKPYLEQLLKVGFHKVAQASMEGSGCPWLTGGRTVMETLGVTKNQYNMLRELGDPEEQDVVMLRYAGEISRQEFATLRQAQEGENGRIYEKYIDMRPYATPSKIKNYIDRNGISQRDYFDYARWLRELGYDLRDGHCLFPRDFRKAHDEKGKEYMASQDRRLMEEMERFNKALGRLSRDMLDAEPMKLKASGLFIRLPKRLDELKDEGEALHHCVGTYRDKVAKGETMVFFIRREADPDRPYYTLEWKGKVVQCRGMRNCSMTPDVREFVETFQEKMEQYAGTAQGKIEGHWKALHGEGEAV